MYRTEKPLIFIGPLAQHFEKFVMHKRALGCKYYKESSVIRAFDKMSMQFEIPENTLTKELVEAFTNKRTNETDKSFSTRVTLIRQLALYMIKMGNEAYLYPQPKSIRSSFAPHIFTTNEILKIFNELGKIEVFKHTRLRHKIYPVLFRVLYGCGLRINEALHLKISDVNLENGIITVKTAKFNTERLIPMSKSLTQICRDYYSEIISLGQDSEYFFPANDGGHLSDCTVHYNFKKTLKKCGMPYAGRGSSARVHDFCHTFAVHTLNRWVRDGKDLYTLLPTLSTYLGHSTFKATERYLRLTAEMYPDIVKDFEEKFSEVIPGVYR